ncbi:MAG: glycosyltransferase [Gemmatimonadota bacterium]
MTTTALAGFVAVAVVALTLRRIVLLGAALMRPRPLPSPRELPGVTILVAARNERVVAPRLLDSLDALDHPPAQLAFVFVCDGCTDDTPVLFRTWAAARSNVQVLELPSREGKAAALNAGLRVAATPVVVVLDADLSPQASFLRELVRPLADTRVGASAAFLSPLNARQSIVSRYAAVTSWVHQLVTSAGVDRLGLNPPTLGAAAYRRAALEEIGGFPAAPAGVDVATSTMLVRAGWTTRFVPCSIVSNTVVATFADYWRQHVRWSRGTLRLPVERPVRVRAALPQRVESLFATLGYGDRVVFAMSLAGVTFGVVPTWVPALYLAAPAAEVLAALLKAGVRRDIHKFASATVVFFAIDIVASLVASGAHLIRRPYTWHSPRAQPATGASTNDGR